MTDRTERITFVVTSDEKEHIRSLSDELGKNMSEFIRNKALYEEPYDDISAFFGSFSEFKNDVTEKLNTIEKCACHYDPREIRHIEPEERTILPEHLVPPPPPPPPTDIPPMAPDIRGETRIICRPTEARGTHGGVVCELQEVIQKVELVDDMIRPSDIAALLS